MSWDEGLQGQALMTDTPQRPHTIDIVTRLEILQALIAALSGATGQALVDAVLPLTESWVAPFVEIASSLEQDEFGPKEFGDAFRQSIAQPEMPTDVDYVRIMSLQKSKGLTADLVVVCGCLQCLIPSIETASAPQEQHRTIEEQRGLFYVAITRSRQTLVVSSVTRLPSTSAVKRRARRRQTIGGTTHTIASEVIHELGSQCPAVVTGQQFGVLTSGQP